MSAPLPPLSAAQQRALARLLDAPSVAEAACSAGVPLEELFGWLESDEAFQSRLEGDAEDAFNLAGLQLLHLTVQAARTLADAMAGAAPEPWAGARVQAAHVVLQQARIYRAADGLEGRIARLEKAKDAMEKRAAECVCGAAHLA
ncbi:MAG: hypothetical protein GC160_25515 [Acidobacteria bacterium]|nr:hypothetical protein [Acidobacteriota bacterium]